MRKYLSIMTVIIFVIIVTVLPAKPVTIDKAENTANGFIKVMKIKSVIAKNEVIKNKADNIAYVFHLDPEGFIIVSADDQLTPIYAFSKRNHFSKTNDNVIHFINTDLTERIRVKDFYSDELASKNNEAWEDLNNQQPHLDIPQDWTISPPEGLTETGGWITTTWGQGDPLNMFCPIDPGTGNRSVVGCVATSFAQLVNYHKFFSLPNFTADDAYTSQYTSPEINIDSDSQTYSFPTFSNLNQRLTTLQTAYLNHTVPTHQDKAALNLACGFLVEMSYSESGSGSNTFMISRALRNRLSYNSAASMTTWEDETQFYDNLKNDMRNARPGVLSIFKSQGYDGHAINVDGYRNDTDMYHLNFGWNGNSDGWYSLPANMPENYDNVSSAVYNVEGGDLPFYLTGTVSVPDGTPEDTELYFYGPIDFEITINNSDGEFQLYNLPSGVYTVIGSKSNPDGFVCNTNVQIDETTTSIDLQLTYSGTITGSISGPTGETPKVVEIYEDNKLLRSIQTETSSFSMYAPLPGNYTVKAKSGDSYFLEKDISVISGTQTVDLTLEYCDGKINAGDHKRASIGLYNDLPFEYIELTCKLNNSIMTENEGNYITGIRIKAPFSSADGQLNAGIWINENRISSKQLESFTADEWLDVYFDDFVKISSDKNIYIGYDLSAPRGVKKAWLDSGSHSEGFYISSFGGSRSQISIDDNRHICVQAIVKTANYGTISGNIVNTYSSGSDPVTIKAGNSYYPAQTNSSFSMMVNSGSLTVSAFSSLYESTSQVISVSEGSITDQVTITMNMSDTDEDVNDVVVLSAANSPNPFNPETVIHFSVPKDSNINITIYNVKGQKVKMLTNEHYTAGNHSIKWNGTDSNLNSVSTGVYFYKVQSDTDFITGKMLLIK